MTRDPSSAISGLAPALQHRLPGLLSAIPVVVIPAIEWLPFIPATWRPWLILGSLVLAVIGIYLGSKRAARLESFANQNASLRRQLEKAEPEYFLHQIATSLFRDGAWRLSVLEKGASGEANDEVLSRLATVSSDPAHARRAPSTVPIVAGTQFAHIFTSNLADPRYRQAEESGSFPDDPLSDGWVRWCVGIFGDLGKHTDTSTLRPCKFAWFAAQDPKSTKVFVVLAESTTAEGIALDLLRSPLTASWLFFIAHLADLRKGGAEAVHGSTDQS